MRVACLSTGGKDSLRLKYGKSGWGTYTLYIDNKGLSFVIENCDLVGDRIPLLADWGLLQFHFR